MRIVYLIAGQGERDAIAAPLSVVDYKIEHFQDVQSFLARPALDPAACLLVDLESVDDGVMARLRALREPLPIILLSSHANVPLAVKAMKEGAADVLQKPAPPERLLGAVSAALEESRARVERAQRQKDVLARFRSLSARERDVVDAVLDGHGNREVASQLGIKLRTVEIHRSHAMTKLGARTLADLVRIRLDVDGATARLSAE
ncbi:MAG: response regulator transcription factor [Methylocystis sp.]|uniref:response regulator transcription factor n=1 Tax=Methylocystis sp. TaxID=1911079 RepID=UPI003DA295FC